MRHSTYAPVATKTATPTSTSDIKTIVRPTTVGGQNIPVAAFYITVETTNARITLDGSDPTAGGGSHVIIKDQPPLLILVGAEGTTIKAVSTAAANAVVNVTWLA